MVLPILLGLWVTSDHPLLLPRSSGQVVRWSFGPVALQSFAPSVLRSYMQAASRLSGFWLAVGALTVAVSVVVLMGLEVYLFGRGPAVSPDHVHHCFPDMLTCRRLGPGSCQKGAAVICSASRYNVSAELARSVSGMLNRQRETWTSHPHGLGRYLRSRRVGISDVPTVKEKPSMGRPPATSFKQ